MDSSTRLIRTIPAIILTVSIAISSAHAVSDEFAGVSADVVELATREKYEMALELIDSLIVAQPLHPYGHVLKATVLIGRAVDFEDELDFPAILKSCDRAEELAVDLYERPNTSVQYWFYVGMIEMYRSIVKQAQGSWLTSLPHVLSGGKYLQMAHELDSTYWDVHYGLGMYLYYRSERAGILRTIGLVADRRENGLRHIRIAAELGRLTKVSARNSMAWIAYEKGDYDEAIRRAANLRREYPGVRAFSWIYGKALVKAQQWREAIPVFQELLKSVRAERRNNHFNEIECLHKLAMANWKTGDRNKAKQIAGKALELELSEKVLDRKREDLEQLRHIFRELGRAKP